jgi:YebC/PmpR family DNA-binding regulatory protein
MSGHNKWSTIKHKKGAADAKRGKLFSRLIKEITVYAREGGGDPGFNPRLRTAIDAAKAANMPVDNIKNAVKRGTGELPGVSYEEITYEGYGPAGVAIMIKTLTDNKNRTVAEIRHIFDKYGGSMGETGCVGWMFDKKGVISIEGGKIGEDELMERALEAGADDVNTDDPEMFVVYTAPESYFEVVEKLRESGLEIESSELTFVPQNYIKLEGKDAEKVLRLMDKFEDSEDVQAVVSNFDIDDDVLETIQGNL